jgi:hypothetical protein
VTRAARLPRRFRSQAFSTSQRFPSKLGLWGLVSCPNHSWVPPLQRFPLTGRVVLSASSRSHVLPCSYPPTCEPAPLESLSPLVSPTPTLSRSGRVPPTTMGPLFTHPKTRFPVALGLDRRNRTVPPASPASKLYSPCESVRVDPSCPVSTAVPFLRFCAFGASLSTPWILGPTRAEARTRPAGRDPVDRSPRDRVKPSHADSLETTSSAVTRPCSGLTAPL